MTGSSWLFVAVVASVHATEFQLDTDTPDALCPELSMTREAVRQRLGQLETEAGARWRGSYSTVHDPSGRRGDYVRLVIRDAQGKEHLDRELPLKGESCDTLAQAIALVVDGFFRELAQASERNVSETPNSRQSAGSPSQQPRAAEVAVPQTVRQVPSVHAVANAQRNRAENAKQSHSAGLTFSAGYESVSSRPALDLGGFLVPAHHWQLQLHAALPLSNLQETHEGVTASAYLVPWRFSFNYVVEPHERIRWFLGPEALMSLEHASTRDVPNGNSGWRASLGVGAQTGLGLWLTPALALVGSASIERIVMQSRKYLMYEHPVFELARTRLSGTLGLWMVIWP